MYNFRYIKGMSMTQKTDNNNFAEKTYVELVDLINKNDSFFFKDFELDGKKYRIFNYRLATWSLFLEPSALNCRGTMFDVTDEKNVKLVSLPPEKFFNYEEGGVDHTSGKLGVKMNKLDGSLISTYIHNEELYLKSKGSLFSEQANDAMKLLGKEQNIEYKNQLENLSKLGYTVSLEYTAPHNRIVIPYQKEELTVLSVRNHKDGKNYYGLRLIELLDNLGGFDKIKENIVSFESLKEQEINQLNFVDSIRQEQSGEGYVVEIILDSGDYYLTKIKNLKYIALHHTKDSVNSPRRLFEAIINEASDDLRSMFADDLYVLDKINEMESFVQPIYNHIVKTVEDFVLENKSLDRKTFAIKAKDEHSEYMGLIMNSYLDKENNYKEFAIKRRKELFKIGDEEPDLDEDGNVIRKTNVTKPI